MRHNEPMFCIGCGEDWTGVPGYSDRGILYLVDNGKELFHVCDKCLERITLFESMMGHDDIDQGVTIKIRRA